MCGYTLFAELRGRDTWALPRIFRLFWKPQKVSTKITPSEKILAKIYYPKSIPESKFSNPKMTFDHRRHLSRSTPPPPPGGEYVFMTAFSNFRHKHIVFPRFNITKENFPLLSASVFCIFLVDKRPTIFYFPAGPCTTRTVTDLGSFVQFRERAPISRAPM